MKQRCIALVVALISTVTAHAQAVVPGNAQDFESMQKAMEAAQASASRPGDEDLTCEQLQEELAATANDPALQAHIQEAGAQAQKDMEVVEQAQKEIASQTATTVAGSLVPGASMGAMAATAANAEVAKARGAERMQSMMGQAGQMTALMPTLMRGERVIQLAVSKKCEWAADIDPTAGVAKPSE